MTRVMYRAEIFSEGDCFVGLCRELDVSSFGDSPKDARLSLQEAIEAFLKGCEYLGTVDDVLVESGFEKKNDIWRLRERIIEEKTATIHASKHPENTSRGPCMLGLHTGSIWMSNDFDAPLPDGFWLGSSQSG